VTIASSQKDAGVKNGFAEAQRHMRVAITSVIASEARQSSVFVFKFLSL